MSAEPIDDQFKLSYLEYKIKEFEEIKRAREDFIEHLDEKIQQLEAKEARGEPLSEHEAIQLVALRYELDAID